MSDAPLPPLAELLRKSRELRLRMALQSRHADQLKESVHLSKVRLSPKSYFSPE